MRLIIEMIVITMFTLLLIVNSTNIDRKITGKSIDICKSSASLENIGKPNLSQIKQSKRLSFPFGIVIPVDSF